MKTPTRKRIQRAVFKSFPKSGRTILWLLKMIVPISLAVRLLQYSGVLDYVSAALNPVFHAVGLPGEASIAFVCSVFLPLYAPVAIAGSLALTIRQLTILGIMCLISHNTFVETAVQKKTGSNFIFIWLLRISMSFVAGWIWNQMLPADMGLPSLHALATSASLTLGAVLNSWVLGALELSVKIALIVTALMILQQVLEEFHIMDRLSRGFAPVMKVMGLSGQTSFLWIVANVIGLTYGSAVLIEQVEAGKVNLKDAKMLNNHLAISHSLLEDTSVFAVVGVPFFWLTVPRVILAVVVVWLIRGATALYRKSI